MNKELLGKETASLVRSLISEHVKITFDDYESNVFLGLVTAAGDIIVDGKPHKFISTYNYRTSEIKIVKSDTVKKKDQ